MMTVNQIIGDSPNHISANFGKRFFAWMMAQSSSTYDKIVGEHKRSLFANLQGKVLEIGPGTGPNLPYYPKDIHWIGIEPNPHMHSYLQEQAKKLGLNIDLRIGNAEWLDAEDNSIDTVVSTLVLCSVPNIDYTLQAILRVLKPGGSFLFIEHVAAPKGTVLRQVQSAIRPIWKVIGDGCHPDRETLIALENAGFSSVNYERFDAQLPIVSPHIIGVATK
ncbi:class I SAM-dependent methyltransferase [Nostoc sp. UCD121]|uniref:class I SAM-dependent methyltransferase n=1 Tax=unclassified Nostoc TaxID=2593658 RepID=UPI001623D78A|nr:MULTISPECIES: class I SAM-dependent methyltransferase [unclassified Nostoc]MBC1220044.1 class I SAM-dependent methyltransferase [Nostoc sp. UCD120]MBC1278399.1 class I SAM-dependent methyltransferase [Nostoc sp. UCD121]MBC1295310.1 class I SAM-dependent methyltransferase [Nostoc sp. UCD122]